MRMLTLTIVLVAAAVLYCCHCARAESQQPQIYNRYGNMYWGYDGSRAYQYGSGNVWVQPAPDPIRIEPLPDYGGSRPDPLMRELEREYFPGLGVDSE